MFNASILYWAISLDNHSRRYSKRVRTVTGLALRRDCVKSECGFSASGSNLMLFPKLIIRYGPVQMSFMQTLPEIFGIQEVVHVSSILQISSISSIKITKKDVWISVSTGWILGSGWIWPDHLVRPIRTSCFTLPCPTCGAEMHSDVRGDKWWSYLQLNLPNLQTCSHYLQWFSVILGHLWRILFRKSPKVSTFLVRNCKDDLPHWGRNSPLSWGGHCYSRSMAMSPGDCDGWFFQKGSL